jgi:hypothetical protein
MVPRCLKVSDEAMTEELDTYKTVPRTLPMIVLIVTNSHRRTTDAESIDPMIFQAIESMSVPRAVAEFAIVPSGKVNPHHPLGEVIRTNINIKEGRPSHVEGKSFLPRRMSNREQSKDHPPSTEAKKCHGAKI